MTTTFFSSPLTSLADNKTLKRTRDTVLEKRTLLKHSVLVFLWSIHIPVVTVWKSCKIKKKKMKEVLSLSSIDTHYSDQQHKGTFSLYVRRLLLLIRLTFLKKTLSLQANWTNLT